MARTSPLAAVPRVLEALRRGERLRVVGAERSVLGLLLARAAVDHRVTDPADAPLVHVAADEASARAVAADVAFFLGRPWRDEGALDGPIVLLPEPEGSPYADASPDPRAVGARMATLARLLDRDDPPRIVIGSVRAWARRAIDRPAFERLCRRWATNDEVGRDTAIAELLAAGYTRAEVVEDPGTFAVRGGVMDVFVPRARFPARIEWFGDDIERVRLFDPESQRSLRDVDAIAIHPVRETVRTGAVDLRARVLAVADQIEVPSAQTRQVLDNLEQGVEFFGIDGLAPLFHREMVPTWAYLGAQARWFIEHPDVLEDAARAHDDELREAHARAVTARRIVAAPHEFYVDPEALLAQLRASAVVAERVLTHDPLRDDGRAALVVERDGNLALLGALERARARKGAHLLEPVVRHLAALDPRLVAAGGLDLPELDPGGDADGDATLASTTAAGDAAARPVGDADGDPGDRGEAAAPASATASPYGRWDPASYGDRGYEPAAAQEAARGGDGEPVPVEPAPWRVVIVAPNLTHAERMTAMLRSYGLLVDDATSAEEGPVELHADLGGRSSVQVMAGALSEGFASAADRLLLLSEADVFGKITRRARSKRKRSGTGDLAQLGLGDYVVHVTHGVGRYAGLHKLDVGGLAGDFLLVEYAGSDKLYLPVYRVHEIERYLAADAKPPRLDKMGGATFATKAAKVKQEVRELAEELLQIYAQREAAQGHAYPGPDELYREFEATFPFEETEDQDEAIAAVQRDLGSPRPMDRLICGDVGFGKTEVALRAAFRVASQGKQVAVLAPTTVLVQQHYHGFRERLEPFGIRTAILNRFVSAKERREAVDKIQSGEVDLVVGTHQLLSREVRFKDLGLVVIDEEQRFGVAQKERFKKLKSHVDVLTLSATPIPRTLHMSLVGIRDLSMIMTPPVDRLAIRTTLTREGDVVIDEAVRKELARGGQVFYVVPKVQGIEEHARRVRDLVPEARVLVAHGQMPGELLERTMVDFVEHRADVLVSTTIIESGIDIPRANTMLIARADQFGLAQLYQLRGRIGRSRYRAYCHLMVHSLERLSPDARRRLETIVRHSELGAGFHVAAQDLEIRGAGDVLGGRQSGQIQAVGFEAYARILEEAVAELRGQPIAHEADPEMAFDVPSFLPDDYVDDTGTRLDLYRRLSSARDVDGVRAVMEEVRDRFGELPTPARHLGHLMGAKTYGRALRAAAVELRGARLTVRLGGESALGGAALVRFVKDHEGRAKLSRVPGGLRLDLQVPELRGDGSARHDAAHRWLVALVDAAAPSARRSA